MQCIMIYPQNQKSSNTRDAFTPLEKATDFSRWLSPYKADGGLKPPSAHTVRERSSLTGFTFIEMLIVTGILSVISIAIFSTLNNGLKIWKKVNMSVAQDDINIFFERFAKELRNTFTFNEIEFLGEDDRLTFSAYVTTIDKKQNRWSGIGEVTYWYDSFSRTLNRRVRGYSQIYEGNDGFERTLLEKVDSFEFSYYFYDKDKKEYIWQDDWKKEEFPISVRLKLEFYDDQKLKTIIRTIDIPQAVLS